MSATIYILDDDVLFLKMLQKSLNTNDFNDVSLFTKSTDLFENLVKRPDVILLDHHLYNETGLQVLEDVLNYDPSITVIYMSAQEKGHIALESIERGAFEYVEKGADMISEILELIHASQSIESTVV